LPHDSLHPPPEDISGDDDPEAIPEDLAGLIAEAEEHPEENDPEHPQRFAGSGVHQDMGTVALHPTSQTGAPKRRTEVALTAVGAAPSAALPPGGWSELTDAEIMLRVAAGDEAGFTLLVEKYRRQMVHFMFRMVHNQAVAEELAQEVFLRVYRARASYRAEAKFSTWLYRIATNLGVNHARDTRLERTAPAVYLDQTDPETGMTPDVADSTPTAEQGMVREARLAAIRKHVMALPERQRAAVLMHKYQDLDYKQIGAVLKLSESATKSLLFRAYQTLRERLQEFV
jgi:RNA polymerase sigma-70 factor, ECF subfamily